MPKDADLTVAVGAGFDPVTGEIRVELTR